MSGRGDRGFGCDGRQMLHSTKKLAIVYMYYAIKTMSNDNVVEKKLLKKNVSDL